MTAWGAVPAQCHHGPPRAGSPGTRHSQMRLGQTEEWNLHPEGRTTSSLLPKSGVPGMDPYPTVPQMEGMRLGHARMFLPREPEPQQGTGTISLDAKEVFQADNLACFLSDLHLCSPSIPLQGTPKACWGLEACSELWAQLVQQSTSQSCPQMEQVFSPAATPPFARAGPSLVTHALLSALPQDSDDVMCRCLLLGKASLHSACQALQIGRSLCD